MRSSPWLFAALITGGAACHLVGGTDGLYIAEDGAGGSVATATSTTTATTTSTTSTSSAGGAAVTPECIIDDDCLSDAATTCAFPRCVNDHCEITFAPPRTLCAETDGNVCDGAGQCVECVDVGDCPNPAATACTNQYCIATGCDSNTQDGGETDVDCGGPCAPCFNGQGCLAHTDCTSGFCNGTTCSPCNDHADCTGERYCHPVEQICKNQSGWLSGCSEAYECTTNCCNGLCCCS